MKLKLKIKFNIWLFAGNKVGSSGQNSAFKAVEDNNDEVSKVNDKTTHNPVDESNASKYWYIYCSKPFISTSL